MAVASWMLRNRNRSSRFSRKTDSEEHNVKLDLTKHPGQNIQEILSCVCQRTDITDAKRLNYLNAFVKLTLHINGNFADYGFSPDEILCCLRVSLVHESTQVRSGGFRAIRHMLRCEDDIKHFNNLLIPFLIARSLDLALKNDAERIEALKLVRKVLMLSPSNFDVAISRSLVSLANGGIEEKDRMLRACLATLSELGTLNPELFIRSGGVASLMRNLMECQTPRIAEALCGVLLLLLDKPHTRDQAAVDLHCVAAPYCDFHYRHGWMDKNRDERELRFNCSRLALLSILRSWPGILHFCSPNNSSGLKAIVDVLYLKQLEVRKAVLDLLYELLGLPQPEWTDELSVALSAVDPAEPQSSWRLNEGFVAAEGRSILPHLAKTLPSISDMHLALLLYCFLENGLLGALSEVIATSDTFISVRAMVLLGELLRLMQILLPPECCNVTPALPNLMEYATNNSPQALRAVTALQQLHKLLKRRPASYSLYMDFILQCGHFMKSSSKVERVKRNRLSSARTKLTHFVGKEEDLIKETGVLTHKDAFTWNWNLIRLIIKGDSSQPLDISESSHRTFLKRLVEFYTPSKNRYSHMDLTSPKLAQGYTVVGIELVKLLMELGDPEATKLLLSLFIDISNQISAITTGKSAHDCLFSPQHMATTQCQSYFMFIGRLGGMPEGVVVLRDLKIFNQLQHLASTTNHDCYVKLIISSLDYREAGPARDLLASVLACPSENSRLYATQFLLVLLRAGLAQFSTWGVRLLANQLRDRSRAVYLSALCTLQEACEVPSCLEQLIKLNPDLLDLGEKGILLLVRFLSVDGGFSLLNRNDFVVNEIVRWDKFLNFRYVRIVEGDTADVLTLHQRGEDGRYDKRTSSIRATSRKDLFLPPHLYGQLAKHSVGFQMLLDYGSVDSFIDLVRNGISTSDSDHEILRLKAAVWALGQLASSEKGVELLYKNGTIASIVSLAQTSVIFSIRATAYYSLGLVATTKPGADCLFRLGWVCARHDRHDKWPIIEDENWEQERIDLDNGQSHDSTHASLESEHASGDQDFVPDCCYYDHEDIDILFPGDAVSARKTPNKSSTLPASQTQSTVQHKRSLSESKTFEMTKYQEQRMSDRLDIKSAMDVGHRHRNNSTTESTTSGVSSCDSVLGKTAINDRVHTLSPIPSSSSLNTIRRPGMKPRRHSESSRTASVHSATSDRSTLSPANSMTSKLSYQDRIGYEMYRSIRRQYPIEELTDILRMGLNSKSYVVYLKARQLSSSNSDHVDGSIASGHSLSSLSSVQKFSVKEGDRPKGQCYMGICLPQKLTALFPESAVPRKHRRRLRIAEDVAADEEHEPPSFDWSVVTRAAVTHDASSCLRCRRTLAEIPSTSAEETTKQDVLLQIERLANPILIRQAKQALLHHKQKHPQIFQDVCVYSDVCKMVSQNTYRLGPRRVLQELFLDVSFEAVHEEPRAILTRERTTNNRRARASAEGGAARTATYSEMANEMRRQELASSASAPFRSVTKGFNVEGAPAEGVDRFSPRSPPLSSVKEELASNENLLQEGGVVVVSPTITSLDSLRFSYKENKFPVKHREDSKVGNC